MPGQGKLKAHFLFNAMKKIYFKLLLSLLLPLCAPSVAAAADFSEVNPEGIALNYTILATEEGTTPEVEVSGFTETPTDTVASFTLPGSVTHDGTTYNVTTVGEYAFRSDLIKSATLGEGIKTLKKYSFGYCLTSINLPESLENIEVEALGAVMIKELYIPKSVKNIGANEPHSCPAQAFYCEYLERIEVSYENENFSSNNGILYNKDQTKLIYCPAAYTQTLAFPSTVKEIEKSAFISNRTIKRVVFPAGRSFDIGSTAFYGSKVEFVKFPDNSNFTIDEGAFALCTNLKEIYFGDGVSYIYRNIFHDCWNLKKLEVSSDNLNYSTDGIALFNKEKTELYAIVDSYDGDYTVPSTVIKMHGLGGWHYGTKIDHLTIPESVKEIGSYCLSGKIIIENPDVMSIKVEDGTFWFVTSITVPPAAVEAYKEAWPQYAGIINGGEFEMSIGADEPLSTKTTVKVPVSLKNAEEIIGFQCDVHLPYSTEIAKDSKGHFAIELSDRAGKSHTITSGVVTDGTSIDGTQTVVRIVCISMSNAKINGKEGVLFTIPLKRTYYSEPYSSFIAIDNIHLSKPGNVREDLPWVKKYFFTIDYAPGDADDDGQVSVVDVTSSISHMIGQTPPRFNLAAVDFDKDEAILINDVTTLVDMVLSTDNSADEAASAPRRAEATETVPAYAMTMDNVSTTPDSEAQLAISMTNEQNIIGFQCDITLPEGVTINQSDGENYDIELSPDRSDDHFVASKKVAGKPNTVRVLAASLTNSPFIGHEGVLFTCPVTVNVPEKDYEITVSNIILSAEGNNRIDVPSYNASLSVGTSGIAQPAQEAAEESPEQYYDLQGRPADASTRGIIVSKKGKRLVK